MKKIVCIFTLSLMTTICTQAQGFGDTVPHATLNVNNVSTPVFLFGNLSYDGNNAMWHFNNRNDKTVYATGLWIGSDSNVAAMLYGSQGFDFFPGPLRITDGTTDAATVTHFNRVWHITREMIDYHISHVGDADYQMADEILTWPGNGDSSDGFSSQLAPYYDADNNGHYNPMAGDYPLIRGDECIFSIFNDAYGEHLQAKGLPLGVEIHSMTYAFNEPQDSVMHNAVFVHYDIFNRSTNLYGNTYLGAFVDYDIGNGYNDYIGCDVANGMFYGYDVYSNSDRDLTNRSYTGCVILGGPMLPADGVDNRSIDQDDIIIPGDLYGNMGVNGLGFGDGIVDNERMGMTNFTSFENSMSIIGQPKNPMDYINYMKSVMRNGVHISYGGQGINGDVPCNFMYPGDSDPWHWGTDGVENDEWSQISADVPPADVRGVSSCGPFNFVSGGHEQLDLVYVSTETPSVSSLREFSSVAHRQFNRDTTDSGKPFLYRPYSDPLAIEMATGDIGVTTMDGNILVRFNGTANVTVYDMMGRLVASTVTSGGSASVKVPQTGVYMVRVGELPARKVVVMR